jgi:hypothetical protein
LSFSVVCRGCWAGRHRGTPPVETTLITDSGTENVNGKVDALLDREGWRRVLAQVEVSFSNSMFEGFPGCC